MGGPGANVLLREPLTQEQTNELDAWLHSIAGKIEVKGKLFDTRERTLWFKPDILPEEVSPCVFYFSIEDTASDTEDESERAQFQAQIGYIPAQAIGFSSGCNQKGDHRTLGLLTLQLAERYHSLISLDGAITPPRFTFPPETEAVQEIQAWSSARKAFIAARYGELEKALPRGKTLRKIQKEYAGQPNSPFVNIHKEADEKFGSVVWLQGELELAGISAFVHSLPGKIYEFHYTTANEKPWVWHVVDTTFMRAWLEHPYFHMIK